MAFFLNGMLKNITIDDFIPCSENEFTKTLLPCFAHTDKHGELWPILLEKAWAKLHGSYDVTR